MRLPNRKPGKYTFPTFDPYMLQTKFDSMQAKLEYLKKEVLPKAIKETQMYGENGDFSENAEYQIAKGRLRGINRTISELQFQLGQAKIIEPAQDTATIQIGHTVIVTNINNEEITWKILGPTESDPTQGIISYQSPIGNALLGKKVGEVATVQLKDNSVNYKIKEIKHI